MSLKGKRALVFSVYGKPYKKRNFFLLLHDPFETDNSSNWLRINASQNGTRKKATFIRLDAFATGCVPMLCELSVSFCNETDNFLYLAAV